MSNLESDFPSSGQIEKAAEDTIKRLQRELNSEKTFDAYSKEIDFDF